MKFDKCNVMDDWQVTYRETIYVNILESYPCLSCGEKTHWIALYAGGSFCSQECVDRWERKAG